MQRSLDTFKELTMQLERFLGASDELTMPFMVMNVENCLKNRTKDYVVGKKNAALEKALILIILCHLLSYVCGEIAEEKLSTESFLTTETDPTEYPSTTTTTSAPKGEKKRRCDVHNVDGRWLSRKLGYDENPLRTRIKANGDKSGHLYFYYNCSSSDHDNGCNDSVTEFSVREASNGKACEVEVHSLNLTLKFRMEGEKPWNDHSMATKMLIVSSVCSVTAFLLVISFRTVNQLVKI